MLDQFTRVVPRTATTLAPGAQPWTIHHSLHDFARPQHDEQEEIMEDSPLNSAFPAHTAPIIQS